MVVYPAGYMTSERRTIVLKKPPQSLPLVPRSNVRISKARVVIQQRKQRDGTAGCFGKRGIPVRCRLWLFMETAIIGFFVFVEFRQPSADVYRTEGGLLHISCSGLLSHRIV